MRVVAALFAVAAVAGVVSSGATAQTLTCGAVVTSNVTLDSSLTGCSTGLVVGADGISIDLNGYAIQGVGTDTGSGVEVFDRSGVTVKNGHVRGFHTGVRLVRTHDSTVTNLTIRDTHKGISLGDYKNSFQDSTFNEIRGNTVTESDVGIWVQGSDDNRVVTNSLMNNLGSGLFCYSGSRNQIDGNDSIGNYTGIELNSCDLTTLRENDASSNRGNGIVRSESNGLVERNTANGNGQSGIDSFLSHALFINNVTNGNGLHGLSIWDVTGHGPFHSITGNVANANGGYGILAAFSGAGAIDGGKNRAHANNAATQCIGVVCK